MRGKYRLTFRGLSTKIITFFKHTPKIKGVYVRKMMFFLKKVAKTVVGMKKSLNPFQPHTG